MSLPSPPPPEHPPPPLPGTPCTQKCEDLCHVGGAVDFVDFSSDGVCDDAGGDGLCALGLDCADCGPRFECEEGDPLPSPSPSAGGVDTVIVGHDQPMKP